MERAQRFQLLLFASFLLLLTVTPAPAHPQQLKVGDAPEVTGVGALQESEPEPQQRTVNLLLNITRQALNATKQHLLETNINVLGHEITFNPDDVAEEKNIKSLLTDIIQDEFGGPSHHTRFANGQSPNLHSPSPSPSSNFSSKSRQGRGGKLSKSKKVTTTTTTTTPAPKKTKQSEAEREARYKGYIDAVLGRMNDLIRSKRMDPLRVNLFAGNTATRTSTTTTTTQKPTPKPLAKVTTKAKPPSKPKPAEKNKKPNKPKKPAPKKPTALKPPKTNPKVEKKKKKAATSSTKVTKASKPPKAAPKTNVQKQKKKPKQQMRYHSTTNTNRQRIRSRAFQVEKEEEPERDEYQERSYINGAPVLLKIAERLTKEAPEAGSSSSERRSIGSEVVAEEETEMETLRGAGAHRPVRGILHGLSTIRRSGPVKVTRRSSNSRIVKAKFLLGPVSLDILPKKSSAKSSNDPSATATAKALKGVIEISLQKDGTTRIRKLRVHPPSSVRFDGDGKRVQQEQEQRSFRKIGSMTSHKLLLVANQVLARTAL